MAHRHTHTHTSIILYKKIKKEKPTHTQVTIKHIPKCFNENLKQEVSTSDSSGTLYAN